MAPGAIQKIAQTFRMLRDLSDKGEINYPFSTRESISITKHLNKYPATPLKTAFSNVFDGEMFTNREEKKRISQVLEHYGILDNSNMNFGGEMKKDLFIEHQYANPNQATMPKFGKIDPNNAPHVGGNTWAGGTKL